MVHFAKSKKNRYAQKLVYTLCRIFLTKISTSCYMLPMRNRVGYKKKSPHFSMKASKKY